MTAKVTPELISDLKIDEGYRASAYRDTGGLLHVGYGTLIEAGHFTEADARLVDAAALEDGATVEQVRVSLTEGEITEDLAEKLLLGRLEPIVEELRASRFGSIVDVLPPGVARGVLNMAYNLGVPRLGHFEKMWTALAAGAWEKAADEALDSRWARQVGARSERVADRIRAGV